MSVSVPAGTPSRQERCGERAAGAGAPAESPQVRPRPGAAAPGAGVGTGPSLGPEAPSVLRRPGLCSGRPLLPGLAPRSPSRAAGSAVARGAGWAGKGGADPLPPPLRLDCGNKDPAACPRPLPGPERGPGNGWTPCCGPGRGAAQRLGAPGRCLCSAGTGRSPLSARGGCHQESAPAWGAVPVGRGAAVVIPPGGGCGTGVQLLGRGGYVNLGDRIPPGAPQFRPLYSGSESRLGGPRGFPPRGNEFPSPAWHTNALSPNLAALRCGPPVVGWWIEMEWGDLSGLALPGAF